MRLEELVSDWELDEIHDELAHGNAPDVVAFRHGVTQNSVRDYAKTVRRPSSYVRKFDGRWTDAEKAFVRDNYPSHGSKWDGWKFLHRTWDAIRIKANDMGVTRRNRKTNEQWRKSNEAMLGYRK